MYNLLKKAILYSLALFLIMLPQHTLAKSNVTIQKISYQMLADAQSESYLHIEVQTNRAVDDFAIKENPNNSRQLIFTINNAKIGKIAKQEALDGDIAKKIYLQEVNNDIVQGKIYLNREVNNNYQISKINKGIAIDIYPASARDNSGHNNNLNLSNLKNKIITLDPGHGGSDTGAIGPSGYTEKEATLDISRQLASILKEAGAKVVMTRTTDTDVFAPNASARDELQARVDIGNKAKSDIFVSVHCNAFASPSANGTQTFYYGGSYQGQLLADSIQNEMVSENGLYNRGISTCNFYVVKNSYMPAVLIETAFITNYNEEGLLKDPQWQKQLAIAIAKGIDQYFGNK